MAARSVVAREVKVRALDWESWRVNLPGQGPLARWLDGHTLGIKASALRHFPSPADLAAGLRSQHAMVQLHPGGLKYEYTLPPRCQWEHGRLSSGRAGIETRWRREVDTKVAEGQGCEPRFRGCESLRPPHLQHQTWPSDGNWHTYLAQTQVLQGSTPWAVTFTLPPTARPPGSKPGVQGSTPCGRATSRRVNHAGRGTASKAARSAHVGRGSRPPLSATSPHALEA